MGKQIYFAHTEEDIYNFLRFLQKVNAKIILNDQAYDPLKLCSKVLNGISECNNSNNSLVLAPSEIATRCAREARVTDGTAIEIINCWKWSTDSNTYYDKGRIYLSTKESREYDVHMLALFNKLCTYIKKSYSYQKDLGIYFSLDFKKKYDLRQIFLSQLGQPIHM